MNGDASAKRLAFTNPNRNNFDNRPSSLGHNQRLASISYLVDESQAFRLKLSCRKRTLLHSHDDTTLGKLPRNRRSGRAGPHPGGAKASRSDRQKGSRTKRPELFARKLHTPFISLIFVIKI